MKRRHARTQSHWPPAQAAASGNSSYRAEFLAFIRKRSHVLLMAYFTRVRAHQFSFRNCLFSKSLKISEKAGQIIDNWQFLQNVTLLNLFPFHFPEHNSLLPRRIFLPNNNFYTLWKFMCTPHLCNSPWCPPQCQYRSTNSEIRPIFLVGRRRHGSHK